VNYLASLFSVIISTSFIVLSSQQLSLAKSTVAINNGRVTPRALKNTENGRPSVPPDIGNPQRPRGGAGSAYERPPVPDDVGNPSRSSGGAGRDDCPVVETAISSIVPDDTQLGGYTIAENPTIWIYTPYALNIVDPDTGLSNLAVLRLETLSYEEIYQAAITVPVETPGIIGIPLPDDAPDLEIGETYRWYVRVFCNTTEPRGQAAAASGWIQRVDPGTFAPENLWYDRLTEAGTRLQANPNDSEARSHWNELLEFVDVEGIEDAPVIP